jgi:hypothetical protein
MQLLYKNPLYYPAFEPLCMHVKYIIFVEFLCYQLLGSSSGCSFVETSHHIITWLTYQDGFPKNLSLIYYSSWQLLQSTLAVSSGAGETSQKSVTDHKHVPVWSTGQFDSVIWCCNMVLYCDVIWWCYLVLLYCSVIWHCCIVLLYGDVIWWCYARLI